ncbi:MAG: stage II sporulation protein M [Candidatus Thermoplasmatota archaeon]|nr:stage II sporulation protein M [Candidatus Thermoplasmatota archaeon]
MSHSTWMSKNLSNAILIAFVIELSIYAIVSSISLSNPVLLNSFKSQQNSIVSQTPPLMFLSIFSHNLLVASLEFIPVFGAFLFVESAVSTATIISIQGTATGVPGLALFLSLLLLPHSWLELPVYAIALIGGIYLIYSLLKGKKHFRENFTRALLLYIFASAQLAVAGAFETAEIYFELSFNYPYDVLYPLMMWLPAIPAFYLLIRLFRYLMALPSEIAPQMPGEMEALQNGSLP